MHVTGPLEPKSAGWRGEAEPKVARTIAEIAGSDDIRQGDIAEAIGYRTLDRQLWR